MRRHVPELWGASMPDLMARPVAPGEDSLLGLPVFLSYLGNFPDAQSVVEALLLGPLQRFPARGSAMWVLDGSVLRVVASQGHAPEEVMRWATIDLNVPAPAAACARTNAIQVVTREYLLEGWAEAMQLPEGSESVDAVLFGLDRSIDGGGGGGGDIVSVPLTVNGAAIGVLGFMVNEHVDWQPIDLAELRALSSALGLWLDSPSTPRPTPWAPGPNPTYISMALTGRQKAILRLVEEGRSNAFIATKLGYSTSTIKQELQRITLALDVTSRTDAVRRAKAIGLLQP